MSYYETARRFVILLLAEIMKTTSGVIEAVLPAQPRWLARIRELEALLRAATAGKRERRTQARGAPDAAPEAADTAPDALVTVSLTLRRALLDLEARGLGLDDGLLERMQSDWSANAIIAYFRSCDARLRERAAQALEEAAQAWGPLPETPGAATEQSAGQGRDLSAKAGKEKARNHGAARAQRVEKSPTR